ncbi:F0F1 ATP synthase subunit I [Pikeienuella piscinae]|uniref:ATP synthase protein I n=1 Tax=Pikeienuella piscinae TaxID=2748098 RepID=A0A7L5BXG8_9RHOB|nr:AtpZ/AtpI family protein [Pikeienuella piscinae]QIE57070.1 F0F1 ATP synthase subunit I [Pikeienuella piscinae]
MTLRPPDDPLKALGAKIDAVREARKPKPAPRGGKYSAAGYGWRMTIDLVTGVLVGAAMGWGIDSLLGTMPLFLIVMVLFGFAAGVRVMLKSAAEYEKEHAGPERDPE